MNTTELIYRVLSGNASEEERQQLEQWKTLNDRNRAEFEDINALWEYSRDTGGGDLSDQEHREGWGKIRQHIQKIQLRRKRKHLIIAVVIIVAVLGFICWLSYNRGKREKPSLYSYMPCCESNTGKMVNNV